MPFTVPNAVDAPTYPQQARLDSRDLDIIVAGENRMGVLSGCAVTAQGSPNMTVAVAKGTARINGALVQVAAGNSGTFSAADGTNPRIDLLTIDIAGAKQIVTGTAAPTPVVPVIPAGRVVLARVDVFTNATTITTGQIVDKRVMINDGTALIYPEDYGALGDARRVNDATITSGAATITSATAAFTAGDTGKTFVMVGAGATNNPLTGTVTYASATTVTASLNAGTTVAAPGTELWLGTDDTAALQQAFNACGAGQSVYIDPAKNYIHTARTQAGVGTTASSTTITGTFTAADVNKAFSIEWSANNRHASYIVSQSGTAAVLAKAPATTGNATAVIGMLTILNSGSGVSGQGTLVSTDQTLCCFNVFGCSEITVADINLRNPAFTRQVTRESTAFHAWLVNNLFMRNVTIDGAGSAGLFLSQVVGFVIDDCTVMNTMADGVHMTNASKAGLVRRPVCRYVGDDAIAVVSYTADVGICSDIKIYSPRCYGETGGRGVSVVGGNDITYVDFYVERSSVAGLYVAAEDGNTTQGCKNINYVGGRLLNCNTSAGGDHGAIMIYNGQGGSGYVLENIKIEGVQISDSRRTATANVMINTNATSNTLKKIYIAGLDIEGGQNLTFYAGGAPDNSTQVDRVSWIVDGYLVPDVIVWGTNQIIPQTYTDGAIGGYWRKFSSVYAALNVGQQPATTEWLTPNHTTRGTLAMAAANNWVWFSRVEITRKGGQSFASAGVNPTVSQVTGTTNPRVGLYADDGTGSRPTGAFLYDWGNVAVLTGTVNVDKVATVGITIPPGVYWLAFAYQEASAPGTRATLVTWTAGLQIPNTTLGSAVTGHAWHQTGYGGGALPTVGTLVRDTNPVLVGLKAT